jgi:hypothetical protein
MESHVGRNPTKHQTGSKGSQKLRIEHHWVQVHAVLQTQITAKARVSCKAHNCWLQHHRVLIYTVHDIPHNTSKGHANAAAEALVAARQRALVEASEYSGAPRVHTSALHSQVNSTGG